MQNRPQFYNHCRESLTMNQVQKNLAVKGFHVLPEFLSPSEADNYRYLLMSLNEGCAINNEEGDFHGSSTSLIPNIVTLDESFLNLAQDSRILEVASKFFENGAFPGELDPFQLHLMHARRVGLEAPAQDLHIDSRLCGASPPIVFHAFLYLDDCLREGSGATRVVSGSHKIQRYSNINDYDNSVPLYVRKGTIVFIDSSLYHGSGPKYTDGDRWIITIAYSRWWMRQPFAIPYFTGWPRELTEKEKRLLGFYNYADNNRSSRGLRARGPLPVLPLPHK